MLPNAQDVPSRASQSAKVASVSLAVCLDLLPPGRGELVFPQGKSPSVPEVSINEHRDAPAAHYDVGSTGQISRMGAEVNSATPQSCKHHSLGCRVLSTDARHQRAAPFGAHGPHDGRRLLGRCQRPMTGDRTCDACASRVGSFLRNQLIGSVHVTTIEYRSRNAPKETLLWAFRCADQRNAVEKSVRRRVAFDRTAQADSGLPD